MQSVAQLYFPKNQEQNQLLWTPLGAPDQGRRNRIGKMQCISKSARFSAIMRLIKYGFLATHSRAAIKSVSSEKCSLGLISGCDK